MYHVFRSNNDWEQLRPDSDTTALLWLPDVGGMHEPLMVQCHIHGAFGAVSD